MDEQSDALGDAVATERGIDTPPRARETAQAADRHVDLAALKVIAHPLRVRILDELSKFGPLTASGLGERLGESSGATSYHLRQLAKHDFVREVEGKGSARERWWRRTPVGLSMDPTELSDTPAGREAYDLVNREFRRNQEQALDDYLARGTDVLSRAWMQATTISTANLRMTAEELERLSVEVYRVLDQSILAFRDREPPAGARPVQVQFNAFPIIGGEEQKS
ncbi:helix-turn-helix domain-containing protein [Humibacter sp.]|jgi:DNA-binding transcriptional ArsR family regulator|uniref:helix-turn-helix domain-containing protein n=1 Tax=Humibacter sp. TaxID=1940291 RepID=UPI002D146842|nr:helix-turn-helix domain-containing protein [Humibacter sp.]HVX07878.1 helix-turn-helix domain-containing protein [Humibacter sp.]